MGTIRPNDEQCLRALLKQVQAAHKTLDELGIPNTTMMGGGRLLDLAERVKLLAQRQ